MALLKTLGLNNSSRLPEFFQVGDHLLASRNLKRFISVSDVNWYIESGDSFCNVRDTKESRTYPNDVLFLNKGTSACLHAE